MVSFNHENLHSFIHSVPGQHGVEQFLGSSLLLEVVGGAFLYECLEVACVLLHARQQVVEQIGRTAFRPTRTHAPTRPLTIYTSRRGSNRVLQLYKNISILFLFPVKDGKLSTGVNATFDASCYG